MNELIARIEQPLFKRIASLLPPDEPVYLVGGAIRDALLKRTSYDLDFVTPGDAIRLGRRVADAIGEAFFPLDTKRRVGRIVIRPKEDHAQQRSQVSRVDFSKFQGTDLISDLEGRDFTMNSLAVEVHDLQKIIDPLGGAADLVAKRLRTCSPRSFVNDPVRILRAVRFSVDLELSIPTETWHLMRDAEHLLPGVSAERVRDELFRILVQNRPSTSLRLLDKLPALEHILPEICFLKGVQQPAPHVLDAWEHTLDTLNRMESLLDVLAGTYNPDQGSNLAMGLASLRLGRYRANLAEHMASGINPERPHKGILFLAGLYHDVGKPKTQSIDETGKIQFIKHEHIGSDLARKRGQALKLSNLETERLATIVKHHMRPSQLAHMQGTLSKRVIYRFFRETGAAGVDICILSLADLLATYGPSLPQERWGRQLDVVRELLCAWWEERDDRIFPAVLIDGEELMNVLDLSPGPIVGYLLESIKEAQAAGDIRTHEEAVELGKTLLREYEKLPR